MANPWLDINPTSALSSVQDIFLFVFFWMLMSMLCIHTVAGLVACWTFRKDIKRWPLIITIFNAFGVLVTAYTGAITAVLIGLVCKNGIYEPQVGLVMAMGIGLSFIYVVLSVSRLLPTMA
eukprot:comp61978_c0_seq1/m.47908 comp61978_c0_seq1/g.47908  ORF comp61978_c0_seq1/g.47908 comp61978_c0_seq1/m.47908 type:complete len:121 (-) comp61978_c0_seq1:493-855(-)